MCTITHRITTVIDSDLVLVRSDGQVAEFDVPARLLDDKFFMFLKLVSEYSTRYSRIPDYFSALRIWNCAFSCCSFAQYQRATPIPFRFLIPPNISRG
ncbi:ABC transporter C family member 5-like [Apium graveolens]|uniref:ABC transporter C family member 5-like n=1 Tax=Apium graveolens TaxID=4045 RepID=UPI003D7986A2